MNARIAALAALAAFAGVTVTGAHASPISATLSATYFEVADNAGDPDFGIYSTPSVAIGSSLGPNGLPVGTGVHDLDGSSEITWWSPVLDSHVKETGTGTITLPYSNYTMFAPNSTGTNDGTYFETAIFAGTFTLTNASTVGFTLGSDDDSFIYVDGKLIGENPGVHAVSTVDFTSPLLDSGTHTVEVFYDDRHAVAAALSLSLDATSSQVIIAPTHNSVAAPEPASLALFGIGLGTIAAVRRRRR